MFDTSGSLRRWLWLIAAIAIAIVATPIAWHYRPLNPTERSLVGTWSMGHDVRITFSEQRRFMEPKYVYFGAGSGDGCVAIPGQNSGGSWSDSGGQLTMEYDLDAPVGPWHKRATEYVLRWTRSERKEIQSLRFEGLDQVWIDEIELTRVRRPFQ